MVSRAGRVVVSAVPQMDGWMDYLDETLGRTAPFTVVPAAKLVQVPRAALSLWCQVKGLYSVTTEEMVEACRELIGGRTALEICTGRSNLGLALKIPRYDSAPSPGLGVQAGDANEVIAEYRPEVVVAAWSVQRGTRDVPHSEPTGVDEVDILNRVQRYILVGNKRQHGLKKVMLQPHTEAHHDWVVSRSPYPNDDMLFVWDGAAKP